MIAFWRGQAKFRARVCTILYDWIMQRYYDDAGTQVETSWRVTLQPHTHRIFLCVAAFCVAIFSILCHCNFECSTSPVTYTHTVWPKTERPKVCIDQKLFPQRAELSVGLNFGVFSLSLLRLYCCRLFCVVVWRVRPRSFQIAVKHRLMIHQKQTKQKWRKKCSNRTRSHVAKRLLSEWAAGQWETEIRE